MSTIPLPPFPTSVLTTAYPSLVSGPALVRLSLAHYPERKVCIIRGAELENIIRYEEAKAQRAADLDRLQAQRDDDQRLRRQSSRSYSAIMQAQREADERLRQKMRRLPPK